MPATAWARPAMLELSERFGVTCAAFARTAGDGATEQATLADQVWDVRSTVPPLRIGQRIPLRAPFGAAFVAWADEHTVDAWTAGTDEQHRRRYTDALAADTRPGFRRGAAHGPRGAPAGRLPGRRTCPTTAWPLRSPRSSSWSTSWPTSPSSYRCGSSPVAPYAVSTLNAPVFDPTGGVCLGLTLLGFGPSLDAERLAETGRDLRRAADTVTKALAAGQ